MNFGLKWMSTCLRRTSPTFVNPCATLAGPIRVRGATTSIVSEPRVKLAWPSCTMKISA